MRWSTDVNLLSEANLLITLILIFMSIVHALLGLDSIGIKIQTIC